MILMALPVFQLSSITGQVSQNCQGIPNRSGVKPWAQNSIIYVNVDANNFTQAEFISSIKPVFDNYNVASSAGGNASG